MVKPLQNPAGEASRARVTTYLTQVMERWQAMAKELGISLSWSVAVGTDVASTLLSQAEPGAQGQGSADSRGCDLIAISTHGRHGLERWEAVWGTETMGSVTDRLLNTTRLPILIVRPPRKG